MMDWRNIRVYNSSQNNAFEEVVCQLARTEDIENKMKYIKVGAPDSGVECFCKLNNQKEIVWQAKYVFDIESVLQQANNSFLTAIKGHPQMCKFILAIPFDLPDPSYERDGKKVKSALTKWNEKVETWKKLASDQNISVEIILWDSSALLKRLCEPQNEGLIYYWFHGEEFTQTWFSDNLDEAISNLGPRYSPELNVELDICKYFGYLQRTEKEHQRLIKYRNSLITFANKFFSKVKGDKYGIDEQLISANESMNTLVKLLQFDGYREMKQLPFDKIEENIMELFNICTEITNIVWEKEGDEYYNSSAYKEYDKFQSTLDMGEKWFRKDLLLMNNHVMLLHGDAGSGKSHLLADVATKLKEKNIESILLLGEQFSSAINPKEQIKQLLQSNVNWTRFLQIINSIGEAKGERFLFMIDALNEGDGNLIWPKYLNGIINDIKKFPWIGLVISVRTENIDEIIPESNGDIIRIEHQGFDEVLESACDEFFDYYNIMLEVPTLADEFANPLYLKVFCEAYANKNRISIIPGLSEVFTEYARHINNKLCKAIYFSYEETLNLVQKSIDAIAIEIVLNGGYSISYIKALETVNSVITSLCRNSIPQYKSFLDALIKENIFKSYMSYGKAEKNITFSYERMGEYFTVKERLKHKGEMSFADFFENDEYFKVIFDSQSFRYRNRVMMLSIIMPDLYGIEMIHCVKGGKIPVYFLESFLQSLVWRKNRSIDEETIQWLISISKRNREIRNIILDNILGMCALTDTTLNIMFIHNNYLMSMKCGDRDAWWTMHINKSYDDGKRIYRKILRWSWNFTKKRNISAESRKLLGITLLWFCTSNNREIRDFATKGLVCIYLDHIEEMSDLIDIFSDVNDMYVLERLYASIYGAIVYSNEKDKIKKISDCVYKAIFSKEDIIAYVPIRDYARSICEYALQMGVYSGTEYSTIETNIVPPYRSEFPKRFPSKDSIGKLEEKYEGLPGFRDIMSSMEMGTGYGDFGRYIFDSKLKDFSNLDIEKMNRWCIRRTIGLGFDPNIHDKKLPGYFGRRGGKSERLGKKYQWIAFYEILAYVSDKYKLKPDWGEDLPKPVNEAWYVEFRNIDPTCLNYSTHISNYHQPDKSWLSDYDYLSTDIDEDEWVKIPPTNIDSILVKKQPNGKVWINLCYFPFWNEMREENDDWMEEEKHSMRGYVNSFLVHKKDLKAIKKLYTENHKEFRDGFEVENCNGLFLRDYFWSKAYKYYAEVPRESLWRKLVVGDKESKVQYAQTTMRHIWEEEYDFSKEDAISIDLPGQFLMDKINLEYSKELGKYYCNGDLVCYNPGVEQESNHLLLMDKMFMEEWLEKNELSLLWIVTVEKSLINRKNRGYGVLRSWDGFYYLDGSEIKGEMEFRE